MVNDEPKIAKRFTSSTKALKILKDKDLSGKVAVVTGASNGIGFETAKSLAFHGCLVIFACRSKEATDKAIGKIEKERKGTEKNCRFMPLELSSLKSTREFIEQIKREVHHIDYLILNAGVFGVHYAKTEDGYESTFQICHLSHFYMTTSLYDLLGEKSRVIIVSSSAHTMANFPKTGLTEEILSPPESKFWRLMAYNNAKLCNILFCKELARRLESKKVGVFALHPGNAIPTAIGRSWFVTDLLLMLSKPFTKSLQQGAATTIYCTTADELDGLTGVYCTDCYIDRASKLAENEGLSKSLWEISEKMIEKFEK